MVQNALNQKCEGQEELQKRVDNKTSWYDCKNEKVQECSSIVARSATITTEDYWTKCKSYQLVGWKTDKIEVEVEEEDEEIPEADAGNDSAW